MLAPSVYKIRESPLICNRISVSAFFWEAENRLKEERIVSSAFLENQHLCPVVQFNIYFTKYVNQINPLIFVKKQHDSPSINSTQTSKCIWKRQSPSIVVLYESPNFPGTKFLACCQSPADAS